MSERRPLRVPNVLSFLSFLDVLFATIGVFIVMLTVQLMAVRDHGRDSPDALVVLRAHGGHLWYTSGAVQNVKDLQQILVLADKAGATLGRPARLVIAYGFEAARRGRDLEDLAQQSWLGHAVKATDGGQQASIRVRFAWRPLESNDPDGAILSKRMIGADGNGARP